jgi:peptidoglycan hydrolase CwlO-like protein
MNVSQVCVTLTMSLLALPSSGANATADTGLGRLIDRKQTLLDRLQQLQRKADSMDSQLNVLYKERQYCYQDLKHVEQDLDDVSSQIHWCRRCL